MKIRTKVVGILACGIGALLLLVDGDPAGILSGRMEARSSALDQFPLKTFSAEDRGIVHFSFGEFSALSTDTLRVSAAPWLLSSSLLVLREADGDVDAASLDTLPEIFRRFGMHSSVEFANWPERLPLPETGYPLGQNVGTASRIMPPIELTISNTGCAACHTSVTYDDSGMPDTNRVWLGGSNSSINLDAFGTALYEAFQSYGKTGQDDRLWATVDKLYPDTSMRERMTLKYVVLPAFRKRIADIEQTTGQLLPFTGSIPGATNGLDALRNRLGDIPADTVVTKSTFNSVPDLGGRLYRDRFLNSGAYTIPGHPDARMMTPELVTPEHRRDLAGIAAYFTVPSMGVTAETAIDSIDEMQDVMAWMTVYEAQPFPASIDVDVASTGHKIYNRECASCHGIYDGTGRDYSLVSFPNVAADMGTDSARLELFRPDIAAQINASEIGSYIAARSEAAYTAPPLDGLWSSAPYFHNGSVPTLDAVLNPDRRPDRFQVGGHALNLGSVGISGIVNESGTMVYPEGYEPWSPPALIDTSEFGLGNEGHEFPFDGLNESEKRALLEFLKTL